MNNGGSTAEVILNIAQRVVRLTLPAEPLQFGDDVSWRGGEKNHQFDPVQKHIKASVVFKNYSRLL